MLSRRLLAALVTFGLAGAIPGLVWAGASEERKLDETIKTAEARLKDKPKDQLLKEWLEHARDYKTGERTDHPGDPPK